MPARRPAKSARRFNTPRSVAKKSTPLGPDSALVLETQSGQSMVLSYWDLWFALVTDVDFDGSWDRMTEHFRTARKTGFSREDAERKLCHLRDLQQRLQQSTIEISDIVSQGDSSPAALRRARNQVLKRTPRPSEWSDAMRYTPKKRRYADALRGLWSHFPESPAPHAQFLASQFQTRDWFSASQSSRIARQLDKFVERADSSLKKNQYAQAQAMLRAFLTVVIELMAVADDSYGSLGDSFHDGFAKYLEIPLEKTGIENTVFFHDLLTLLIWEDYGLTYNQLDGYFERLSPEQGELCIDYLRQQLGELTVDDLDYQYDTALTLLGQVVAEQTRFDLFEELATEMGTREWKRIIVLADRAVKKRKRKLAAAVFESALRPGRHEDFLRKKYDQLKRGKWNPDPRR